MSKRRKGSSSFQFGAETEIKDGCIRYRPDIVIFGDFHEGVGKLLLQVLNERIHSVVSDLLPYLSSSDPSPSEEVPE